MSLLWVAVVLLAPASVLCGLAGIFDKRLERIGMRMMWWGFGAWAVAVTALVITGGR